MPSSDRAHERILSSQQPTRPARAERAERDPAHAGTILRGRSGRQADTGATAGHASGRASHGAAAAAATGGHHHRGPGTRAPGQATSPDLSLDLQQARRIAEERGFATGQAQALGRLEHAIVAAGAMAGRMEAAAPRETVTVAHAIAELALAIARRILGNELKTDPGVLVRALETAVSTIDGSPEAHVLLNPAALEPVRAAWEAVHGRTYLGKHWTFEADPSLTPGGCVVRYEHGFVDASLESQLEEIGIALDAAIPGFWRELIDAEQESPA